MSDVDRVLLLFRKSHGRLISASEIVSGKFDGGKQIIEYSGRIGNARTKMECLCGEDHKNNTKTCTSDEHIVNVKTNWYQYQTTKKIGEQEENTPVLNFEEDLEEKRKFLLEKYYAETDPIKKEVIKQQGLALRDQIEQKRKDKELLSNVGKALL